MENKEKKSAFSVNIDLTQEDLSSLKKIVKDFIKEKANTICSYYRPEAHHVVAGGLVLKGAFLVEDLSKDDLEKVLVLVNRAPDEAGEANRQTLITVSLPIVSTPTGKKE